MADSAGLSRVILVVGGLSCAWLAVHFVIVEPIRRDLRGLRQRLDRIEKSLKARDHGAA